ncbi:cystatin-B-like isoform 1-T1 [Gastrophryne carolinensis]
MSESCGCAGEDPNPSTVPGGWSGEKPADANVQKIANQVKGEFLKKSGVNAAQFVAVSFKSQTVAGRNLFIKVHIGAEHYVHLKVFEPLPHTKQGPQLVGFQLNKKKSDKIDS